MVRREIIKKYAVFGNPIKHSLSPLIHEYFAKNYNIDLSYEPILCTLGKFTVEATNFLEKGGLGFNITLPFKQDAFKFAITKSEIATITGSVNTISIKNGVIHGDNTDGSGFITDLKNNIGYNLNGKKILLVGAGGAARGVIPNILYQLPSEFKIYNRTLEKAQKLANVFKDIGEISSVKKEDLNKYNFDLIINATSIGISNSKFELSEIFFKEDAVCYDMSYGKASNSFMSWAKENNLQFYDGLGMLLEQAADSFYIWEGERPEITDELRKLLKNKL
ncbi:MAG: shikimate dehydrogenase [Gammaproteobacteria bacterium]|jgi:shikimate dehydrogenase|nr:shikimate dehydrogenase [Gammaproteobacteria bacterium]MBT7603745.1 shikimate dehydrogenase [Gammaproteobacteria bacterium]